VLAGRDAVGKERIVRRGEGRKEREARPIAELDRQERGGRGGGGQKGGSRSVSGIEKKGGGGERD